MCIVVENPPKSFIYSKSHDEKTGHLCRTKLSKTDHTYHVDHEGVEALRGQGLCLPRPLVAGELHQPLQHPVEADGERLGAVLVRHAQQDARLRVPSQGGGERLRGVCGNQVVPAAGSGVMFY